uniref:Probable ATP-binding protein YheS n=1 Tax=Candidatus Kentrum sp. FM TaxID=2126340 RepID=A0A450RZA4_9GAMM|nr:MAG: ATP-binding cassette, subfamily F, member 3 [Candidatus Kentron sp. FM]VFJ44988.1 MAG: ATP-binding cassette, subfamily F, member 3 [Candidatus Kentron sp. FM]VFK06614.1 MAG: ATP-binding cassette, subfamily F, member 3 [Candidatus Kentron sp. FM]
MLQLEDLMLLRDGRTLLEQTNLTIHPGQRVGVIGRNGCGKSSLFALLQGHLHIDHGTLTMPAQWTIASVAQETPATERSALDSVLDGDGELRQLENALAEAERTHDGGAIAELHDRYAAIDGYDAGRRATLLIHGLGFAPGEEHRPVASFSGGWRMRLNLARALMCRSDLLLLDEPTNHLDLDAVLWLEDWLSHRYPGTLLLVSHDREFLDGVVQRIVHFEDRRLISYRGNYSQFETLRAERIAQQASAAARQQREIAHIQSFVNRFRAKATKARQAQSRLKALERMQTIAAVHVQSPFRFRIPHPERFGNPLLQLEKARIGYTGKAVLERVTLKLLPGDRIGLLGRNGAGKSTLVKALTGALALQGGRRTEAKGLRIGYFAQHQLEQLDPDAGGLIHLQRLSPEASEKEVRKFLGGFAFSGDHALRPTRTFSGGEKARLALALITWQKPHLLLLDEPTNHLDMGMRDALAMALQEYRGAVVLVTHDRYLLSSATDTWLLVNDAGVTPFAGDLADYRDWLSMEKREERKRGQRDCPRHKVKKLEQEMERLHEELTKIARALADTEANTEAGGRALYAAQNKKRRLKLLLRQSETRNALEEIEEDWLEASEVLEEDKAGN